MMLLRYPAKPADREEAMAILALHNGNALEALRTMIAERDAVEERLTMATLGLMPDRDGALRGRDAGLR